MPEIHVHVAEGQQSVYPEEQIPDLLRQGTLTPETYFWRTGMTQWQPLSRFRSSNESIVPLRRTERLPEMAGRPVATPQEPAAAKAPEQPIKGRRFRFRRQPEPLNTILQIVLILTMLATLLELVLGLLALGSAPGTDSGSAAQIATWAGVGLNCVLLICYCFWIYLTVLNCHFFSSIVTFSARWAVGCHFIPILNLGRPFRVVEEIWKVSSNPRTWSMESPPAILVRLWWTLWLVFLALAACYCFFMNTENGPLIFIALKVVQLIWYGLLLAVVTTILRKQVLLVNPPGPRPASPSAKKSR